MDLSGDRASPFLVKVHLLRDARGWKSKFASDVPGRTAVTEATDVRHGPHLKIAIIERHCQVAEVHGGTEGHVVNVGADPGASFQKSAFAEMRLAGFFLHSLGRPEFPSQSSECILIVLVADLKNGSCFFHMGTERIRTNHLCSGFGAMGGSMVRRPVAMLGEDALLVGS